MRIAALALIALALFVSPALAQKEDVTCAYCDQPWDTRTRVIAVLADEDGAERYHFDSLWHYAEFLFHAEAGDSPYSVLLAGAEDYSTTDAEPSSWLPLHEGFAGDQNVYVWTDNAFPGARKAPFVAAFGRRADAEGFKAAHGGELLSGAELAKRFQDRWNASHGPGGEEKGHSH